MADDDRPRRKRSGLLRGILIGVGIVFAATVVLVLVALANFERAVPYVASAITNATGREFAVSGQVDAQVFSWRPRLRIDGITYANPEWSEEPLMLDIGSLRTGISLRRLLRGDTVITRLRLDDAVIRLEERADGANNWSETAKEAVEPEDRTDVPAIRRIRLNDTRIVYTREGAPERTTDVVFEKAKGAVARRVRVVGNGRYQDRPASIRLEAGSIDELQETDARFPIDLEVEAGATTAAIEGHLVGALDRGGLDVQMRLEGDSLSDLYPLIGVVLPPSPPYDVRGQLEHEDEVWQFQQFEGRMGDSDLSGTVTIDLEPSSRGSEDETAKQEEQDEEEERDDAPAKPDDPAPADDATAKNDEPDARDTTARDERPHMTADFRSTRLDFDDLAGLVGAPAATGAGETANAEQERQVAEQAAQGRVLPDQPVDVPRLNAMDIDARLVAERVDAPTHLPIDHLDLKITLEDGKLQAWPASFDVAGGRVDLWVTLYSNRDPLHTDAELRVRGVKAVRLLGETPFTDETAGRLTGDAKLAMTGRSVREMLASADGSVRLAMTDAQVSELLVELIGLDVMNAIGVALKGDEPDRIRCAAFDLAAENGDVESRLAVIDTPRATLEIDFSLDLDTEQLTARLVPHPKDVSFLSLRQDILVEGPLADLDYYPDPLKLGPVDEFKQKLNLLLAPVVGLLTPFDVDVDEEAGDSGCGAFLRDQRAREPIAGARRESSSD